MEDKTRKTITKELGYDTFKGVPFLIKLEPFYLKILDFSTEKKY